MPPRCVKQARSHGHVWAARWSLTVPDGSRRFGRVTEATKRECEDALRAAMQEARTSRPLARDATTVAEWLDGWLAEHARQVRPQTTARYRRALDAHVRPQLGAIHLQRLGERELRRWLAALTHAGVSDESIAYAHRTLGLALKQAVAFGVLADNPLARVKPPRLEPPATDAWSLAEANALLAACDVDDAIFVVALERGLRRGELLGLRWGDVELERGILHVRQQRVLVGRTMQDGPLKTRRSRRDLTIPDRSLAALKAWRRFQMALRLKVGMLWVDTGYVFTDPLGQPWGRNRWYDRATALIARAGVRPLPPHAFRHTFATLALAAGVNPRVVQEILGHSSVAMTLDRYSHVSEELQRDAGERVDRLLREGVLA
jgi:integrase